MARKSRRPVALVTGAAIRLGRAFAEHLATRGYDLVLHVGTRRVEAERLARKLAGQGARCVVLSADLQRPSELAALFAAIDDFAPRLDLAINSAAKFERAPLLELSDEQLTSMLLTNLLGPMIVCREAARRMKEGGQIVNMLDIGGAIQPWRGFSHYAAAKAGLAMVTRILALELAPKIRVNGIAPGTVIVPERYSPRQIAEVAREIPLGRVGTPRDVMRALDYLLDADFATGTIQVVDGGRSQGPGGGGEVK